jgi:uncharacterized protein (TIGR03086 family)
VSDCLHHALGLLERALGYTGVSLSSVGTDRSGPSPCAGWSLADLLAHMDDGLDAFLEAAGGAVRVEVPYHPGSDVAALQTKACHLLGVWSGGTPARVVVGDRPAETPVIVAAAALEITVHGWDVAQATGVPRPIPEDLAVALLPVAMAMVSPEDRVGRFGPPRAVRPDAPASAALLAFLGRIDPSA